LGREYLIVWAGRHRRSAWEEICDRYRRRIERSTPLREVAVKVKGRGDGPERRRAEGEAILAALPEPVWLVALDPKGRTLSSEELAAELARLKREWGSTRSSWSGPGPGCRWGP
jgi:23S rRNA (pseudouridine1915-N3)-methyltransferase